MRPLRLGSRGSQLARWQANAVAAACRQAGLPDSEIHIIHTSGDRISQAPLWQVGGKGLFVKELEEALLRGEIDVAVHSLKDVPATLAPGLILAAVRPRADARDAVMLPWPGGCAPATTADLATLVRPAARIGTSSLRRSAQLQRLWPGSQFTPIRGNLDTRLRKLDAGEYDALVLAAAGLIRLDAAARITAYLEIEQCVPAPGQGVIALETRDDETRSAVAVLSDAATALAVAAERAVLVTLEGGCQVPLGAHATVADGVVTLRAVVVSPDGARVVRAVESGPALEAEAVGKRAGKALLACGAADILIELRQSNPPVPAEGIQP